MNNEELRRAFEVGARLWDEGRFFEAHEALEVPWQATKHERKGEPARDPRREFFHGLILYAAAYVHWSRGNLLGLERKLADARRVLERAPVRVWNFDVAALREAAEADLEAGLAGRAYAQRQTPRLSA